MKINISNNGKILQDKLNIELPNFTVLTGENGSGKTQLLEYLYSNAINPATQGVSPLLIKSPYIPSITDDFNRQLSDVVYSYPGIKNYNDYILSGPSIQQIQEEWKILEPITKAFTLIKTKKFSNSEDELKALNNTIVEFIKNFSFDIDGLTNSKLITMDQLTQLKSISLKASKAIDELTYTDFLIFYNIQTNIFSSALDLLFHQFYLKQKYYPQLTENISPPWEVFNTILQKANFKYKTEYIIPSDENQLSIVKLVDNETKTSNVTLNSLSSGEKTIIALIFVLYHASTNGNFPEVILFDEPDAHLHPSLTQIFISVIQSVLVDEQKVKVILTTHSPSTIALSPESSIYRMDRGLGYPIKESRSKAIQSLSNGLASITIEEGNLGIEYILKSTKKNILFTEGITDKIILQIAWKKLYNNEIPFLVQDCFCASFLSNLFKNGDNQQDGIFKLAPDKIMIALFDFDQAGYNAWNSIKFTTLIEENPSNCLTMSNGNNSYKMLLPVPDIAEIKSQVIKSENETFRDKSLLTIESLFFNVPNFKKIYFTEDIVPGGGTSFHFKGDKRKFAKDLEILESKHFSTLIPLFEKIKKITN